MIPIIHTALYDNLQVDLEEYGWEYASLGRHTFHTTKRRFDVDRRRRHVRKLVNEKPGAKAVFAPLGETEGVEVIKYDDASSKDKGKKRKVPRMHLEFKGEATILPSNDKQCTVYTIYIIL